MRRSDWLVDMGPKRRVGGEVAEGPAAKVERISGR